MYFSLYRLICSERSTKEIASDNKDRNDWQWGFTPQAELRNGRFAMKSQIFVKTYLQPAAMPIKIKTANSQPKNISTLKYYKLDAIALPDFRQSRRNNNSAIQREKPVWHEPKAFLEKGLLVAMTIAALWVSSLVLLLFVDIYDLSPLCILLDVLGRTFIQTGLFIVAHDAIHGSVYLRNRKLNDTIGRLAVTLYAVLDYRKIAVNHRQHHQYPGQDGDPDFHDCNRFIWYLRFMKGYLNFQQIVVQLLGLGTIFITLHVGIHIPVINLFLFWILPIFLSTIQLFFFGTYLPHRSGNAENSHQIASSDYSSIWSCLTCYHFGYHWEHHEYPFVAWYDLPFTRQALKNSA